MKKSIFLTLILTVLYRPAVAQEVWFFSDGTDPSYYDQGIVDLSGLGDSFFEHTYPPGLPQYNDKVPCSPVSFKGASSLKFNYTSSPSGNWSAGIFRSGWTTAGLSGLDSLSFYIFSYTDLPSSALPLIGLRAIKMNGLGEVSSKMYSLSGLNPDVQPGEWTRITFPLDSITGDPDNGELDFSSIKAILFSQSEKNNMSRTILIDEITAFRSLDIIPSLTDLSVKGYDSHVELEWEKPMENLTYRIFASFDNGNTYGLRKETDENFYLDFIPSNSRNSTVRYRVTASSGIKESAPTEASASLHDYTDDELLEMIQEYTFRYFYEGAHQASGMTMERSDGEGKTVASGATGMGLMAMIIACEREFRPRTEIMNRILNILSFLQTCDRHHGAWSHWYNGNSGRTIPFSPDDDGGDIVETAYVAQALIAVRNYFSDPDLSASEIRQKAGALLDGIDWNWYRNNQDALFWHWSPVSGFSMNLMVSGWSECLVTYIMAASSSAHGITKEVYNKGWARNGNMTNPRTYYNYDISLSPDWGGPLFWIHYSHLGIDPHGLKDQYADYWNEHVNTARIHYEYAKDNPGGWLNYSENCWGLTASDDPSGYSAHQPVLNDNGTISPTAAVSSIPYTPEESMKAVRYFYRERGADLFGRYGFYDAFNDEIGWVKKAYLGIDQGPVIIMIENYRTGLIWNSVMKDPAVLSGLNKLGFTTNTTGVTETGSEVLKVYPNPCHCESYLKIGKAGTPFFVRILDLDGRLISTEKYTEPASEIKINCSSLKKGMYIIELSSTDHRLTERLLVY